MAQIFSFQRSDTIPRSSQTSAQASSETNQPGASAGPTGSAPNHHSWGIHGHAHEQLDDFQASDNGLINISAELLALLVTLPQQQRPTNLPEFRENLVDRVSALNNRGRLCGYPQSLMDRCCYVLCAALDEGINNTAWGRRDGWENHSLLSRLFQQRNGGEIFFVLLDQARQHPEQQAELIELIYVLLRFGFQGRYQNNQQNHQESHDLTRLSAELYTELRRIRPAPTERQAPSTSHDWKPLRLFRKAPWLGIVPVLLLAGYIATAFWINNFNQTVIYGLEDLSVWTAPSQGSSNVIYNSTQEDMEGWSQ
ncbi:type IVB secretion system protein IcmH/DotU [Sansalvadorimonas sp. 2012CJ34-2]|uniref:Type IVB secretion system protein IcmH/DotU n=1 Tax=Parendozoicomonas callyspongiae TaxID=2942213 RepID=A0ABT0PMB4_9GAMM|nr:type IVB secretion system protein IcmH/DotU [Sansalvadorimonas sp. 2012CJ34-2]MCL6272126.1 type IVB secretion system protein IcmH/DotU [Sansalvadorimonas sp. 2012CJ34-2]